MCTVLKADGKVCGAWCDKRAVVGKEEKGSVCEYHLERAVMRRRAGRNEFAMGWVLFVPVLFLFSSSHLDSRVSTKSTSPIPRSLSIHAYLWLCERRWVS